MRAGLVALFCALLLFPTATIAQKPATACETRAFEASRFTVCSLNTRKQTVRLFWTDTHNKPLRGFGALNDMLSNGAGHVQFAMNAGMFDAQGTPIGLFVTDGRNRVSLNEHSGSGNFYLAPNGVFWMDKSGTLGITQTDNFVARGRTLLWATQSGPLLLIDGALNPQVSMDGPSRLIRNGVGILDPHNAYFVISDDPVSFGRLARFFRDALKCSNALYFDGVVSSLWEPSAGRRDEAYALGPMIVVFGR